MNTDKINQVDDEKIVRTYSAMDCGGRCPLRVHVKNGVILRTEGDDAPEPQQLRACLRCRAYRQVVYHPDRLKYPMKRIGERGEGKFTQISWSEALDTVASELLRVKQDYGNSSILLFHGGSFQGALHFPLYAYSRLLSMFGGFTWQYGNVSSEGCVYAIRAQYGEAFSCGNSREDLMNSRLIILWGWDPAKMINSTNTTYQLILAKEAGAKVIAVDPIYTDTAAIVADQWIPIRPGTDTAMIAAMAYVMITENLHNQNFLDTYTVGFNQYRDYVLGTDDGVPKTPAWAEAITGVPASVIQNFAREFATTKPAALMDGLGPARSAVGEQIIRATMTMTAMTGNVGIRGGHAGGGLQRIDIGGLFTMPTIPQPRNPVELAGHRVARGSINLQDRLMTRVQSNKMWDAILEGKDGGYPADFKIAWIAGTNCLNQRCNTNKAVAALKKIEFIVVPEIFMTPTAKFADILLPVCSHWEKNDIARPWPSGPYYCHMNAAIPKLYESKTDFEIACELAPRLGIDDYNDKTEDEWLKHFVATDREEHAKEITDYEKFKREGIHRVKLEKPIVAYEKQIEDPEHNPFPTPSGKIEIYSKRIEDLNNPLCPPIPKYMETWEGPNDPLASEFPLQLVTPHPKRRTHSSLDNVPWLKETEVQSVWINTADAQARGIRDGSMVMVFNDRGATMLAARVTLRIMPGVVSIYEGAWYDPDEQGVDRGGCANVLTADRYSPGGAFTSNTTLVQVKKLEGE